MPNSPLLVGKGLVALAAGSTATDGDLSTARSIFPGATLLEVKESLMDAVTAVSGSGPAYFFAFVEALAAAGRKQGFDAETAQRLATGTFIGAAALLESSSTGAAELRRRVTSPGGTTEAALAVLKDRKFDELIAAAVEAATRRGGELSGA
jgi:pyrroline-5-carboxylate reductase